MHPLGLAVNGERRIFNVLINQIPHQDWPEPLAGTPGFPFHDATDDENAFGDPLEDSDRARYDAAMRPIIEAAARLLESFPAPQDDPETPPTDRPDGDRLPKVLIADVPDSQAKLRTRLITEIGGRARIADPIPPPYPAAEHDAALRRALEHVDLSIHLLDGWPGREMDDAEHSYPRRQAELAKEAPARSLFWLSETLDINGVDDPDHRDWLCALIRAGLIPVLEAGFLVQDRDRWRIAICKPGEAPLPRLATALLEMAGQDQDPDTVTQLADRFLEEGAEVALEILGPTLAGDQTNLLLLVDQFEELFRFDQFPAETQTTRHRAEAETFVDLLLRLADRDRLPVYCAITMRSDFIGDCDVFTSLPEAINRGQFLVPRLTRGQRREAIVGPVRLTGEQIAPRLVDRLLNERLDTRDDLPILQHVLMRCWDTWAGQSAEQPAGSRVSQQPLSRREGVVKAPLPSGRGVGERGSKGEARRLLRHPHRGRGRTTGDPSTSGTMSGCILSMAPSTHMPGRPWRSSAAKTGTWRGGYSRP